MNTKRKDKPRIWKNYFSMLAHAGLPWGLMVVCFVLSLLVAILSLALGGQIAVVFQDHAPAREMIPEMWKLIAVIAAGVACMIAGSHLQGVVTAKIDRNVQKYAVNRIFYLKTEDLEATDTREFITRLTDDTAKNSPFLIELAINEIPRLFYIVAAIASVSQVGQPSLVGAMFLLIPGIVGLAFVSGYITYRNRNKIQARLAGVTARLAEKIDDIEVIKSYSTEEKEIAAGSRVLDELNAVRKEGALVDHINKFISNMIWFIDVVIIVVPPTLLMFNGAIDRAVYAAYLVIALRFETYVKEHLQVWVSLKEAQGATRRLSAVLNLDNEKSAAAGEAGAPGDITFTGVSFAYAEESILKNLSFTIEQGKKTGIVGLSGSGKSTVLNLIEKFYEPDEGTICLGGRDIGTADYASHRSRFAYLPQNAPALSGSVREMLCWSADREYSDGEMEQALRDVLLYDDIMALGGLDYQIGHNGENLSGGQRQKLGIARMLLSDSEIILLDEATSALDPEATALIQKKIDEKCAGKTQVLVAHDLSTIRNADKILVLEQGRLAGQGTHEELMKALPLYAGLVKGV